MMNIIKKGSIVLLQQAQADKHAFVQAIPNQTCRLGKNNVRVDALIGAPYGTIFEAKGRDLVPVQSNELYSDIFLPDLNDADEGGEYQGVLSDNRDYADTNTAQRLTGDEIEKLKQSGASGQDIMQALVQNSGTWEKKTMFSKQKWAKKKAAKYVVRVRAIHCDTPTIADALYNKALVSKGSSIRSDSLAQLLSFGNVFSGATVMVMDSYGGLLFGAVLERLGGMGRAVHVYDGQLPNMNHLKYFNIPKDAMERMMIPFPTTAFASLNPNSQHQLNEFCEETERVKLASFFLKQDGEFDEECWSKYISRRKDKQKMLGLGRSLMLKRADSLIMACKYDPVQVVPRLLFFLKESSPFAIYSEHIEPLVQCQAALMMQEDIVKLQLTSCWWRHYQILPGRSHPDMSTSSDGGYILTGIKACLRKGDGRAGNEESIMSDSPSCSKKQRSE